MKFKKIGKIHLIIIVSIALTIISAGMSKIPSTIDGVIKRPDGKFLITQRVMTKAWAADSDC